MPTRPEDAFAPAGAPAGMPMPRANLLARQAKPGYMGLGRHLMQDNIDIEDMPTPLLPEPFAAEAPMAAPGLPAPVVFMREVCIIKFLAALMHAMNVNG
jgi:hypothetical protein